MQVKKLEKLEFNNLNLNKLQELKDVLCSNKLYIDNEYLYKIFNLENVDESQVDEIKRSNPYVYASIFGLLIVAGGVWYYVKIKGEF